MRTYEDNIPTRRELHQTHAAFLNKIGPVYVNRDLNGRVRLILSNKWRKEQDAIEQLEQIAQQIHQALGNHSFPPEQVILYEDKPEDVAFGLPLFPIEG